MRVGGRRGRRVGGAALFRPVGSRIGTVRMGIDGVRGGAALPRGLVAGQLVALTAWGAVNATGS